MSWKDDYHEAKQDSGLTWDEFVDRRMIHVDDLDSAADVIADLCRHVQDVEDEYAALKEELVEVRLLLESEEFDP